VAFCSVRYIFRFGGAFYKARFIPTALGGAVGIVTGLSQPVITGLTGNLGIAGLIYIFLLAGVIMLSIMNRVLTVNAFTLIMMAVSSAFGKFSLMIW
jgi:hypothetical protein